MKLTKFEDALMVYFESCHEGDRRGADAALASLVRGIGGAATPPWTVDELAAAILLSGGPRRPPTAEELGAILSGNRELAKVPADMELVF
jgi:hypothetical protein